MSKSARRYDIYLPLMDNDGRPIADTVFEALEHQLVDRFGGFTCNQREFPLHGA